MRALILNSGQGTRMGDETKYHPKCMTALFGGQTILGRQLRQLEKSGLEKVIVTTGPFEQQLTAHARQCAPSLDISFVNNPEYSRTNYIYSIYLARDLLDDDLVLLHGDLVFDQAVLDGQLAFGKSSVAVCAGAPLPQKDFKAVVRDGRVQKVGIEFFEDAVAAQPLYVLERGDWSVWLERIAGYVEKGERGCYAENAFNEVSGACAVYPYDSGTLLCTEVDTPQDLQDINRILKESMEGI